jgi:DNA-binding transcriptional LysR family regulator
MISIPITAIAPPIHPSDRLADMEAFVEAAERGSFTGAARRLGVTPSALETELRA